MSKTADPSPSSKSTAKFSTKFSTPVSISTSHYTTSTRTQTALAIFHETISNSQQNKHIINVSRRTQTQNTTPQHTSLFHMHPFKFHYRQNSLHPHLPSHRFTNHPFQWCPTRSVPPTQNIKFLHQRHLPSSLSQIYLTDPPLYLTLSSRDIFFLHIMLLSVIFSLIPNLFCLLVAPLIFTLHLWPYFTSVIKPNLRVF